MRWTSVNKHTILRFICLSQLGVTLAHENSYPPPADQDSIFCEEHDILKSFQKPFKGLNLYGPLPYVHCFGESSIDEKFDIALLGAPFDTGVTSRPGARYGPSGIRTGSRRISTEGAWNVYTGENPLQSWAKIVDCGDPPLTFLDNTVALKQLEYAHKYTSDHMVNATSKTKAPRIIALGGDHTTTLPALRSAYRHWGELSVIHFDSHIDTLRPAVQGGELSDYAGLNHGTYLRIAHEEGLLTNHSIHAGIRGPFAQPKGDVVNDRRCGFEILTARDIDFIGARGIIDKIKERVGFSNVYISVDIDVLDPAFAPGTGTAEVGGWSTRELLTILDGLTGLKIVGADIVEVAPAYDTAGETTVIAAAEIVRSLLALMVQTPV